MKTIELLEKAPVESQDTHKLYADTDELKDIYYLIGGVWQRDFTFLKFVIIRTGNDTFCPVHLVRLNRMIDQPIYSLSDLNHLTHTDSTDSGETTVLYLFNSTKELLEWALAK